MLLRPMFLSSADGNSVWQASCAWNSEVILSLLYLFPETSYHISKQVLSILKCSLNLTFIYFQGTCFDKASPDPLHIHLLPPSLPSPQLPLPQQPHIISPWPRSLNICQWVPSLLEQIWISNICWKSQIVLSTPPGCVYAPSSPHSLNSDHSRVGALSFQLLCWILSLKSFTSHGLWIWSHRRS